MSFSDIPFSANCCLILNKNLFLASSGDLKRLDKVKVLPSFSVYELNKILVEMGPTS